MVLKDSDLHSSMDRLETNIKDAGIVKDSDLHSSMDRLETKGKAEVK